jgi:DNA topoisomerase-3
MRLILAEKPSVGKDLGRVLNCNKEGNGYLEGKDNIVTWALGHLVTLADPESYDSKYASWQLEDLPIIPKSMKTEVIKQTRKQFNTVKELMLRSDVKEIVIATDAGREGELVARWIIEKAGVKKPIKRLWISSVTDKAIREGFNNLKDGRLYESLYASALARAQADWIVGINATRALTTKYNAQLSCGRVQTPTLAMIKALEDEIRDFKPVKYYGIEVTAVNFKFTWHDNNDKRIFDEAKCDRTMDSLKGKRLEIIDISRKKLLKHAPLLYDLTELQRDANNIYGFSAKETLSIMQALYERHKVLTYPRTDSRYLTDDLVETLKDRVKAVSVGPYSKTGLKICSSPLKPNKNFVRDHASIDNSEVMVICGKIEEELSQLDEDEKREFLAEMGLGESGLDQLIRISYRLLGLISFFTTGPMESRAWTIVKGTKAPQAAGKIHSDMERGFIRAEVTKYDDVVKCGSMLAAREKGLMRLEGKDYVMEDGDIVFFRFNV